MYGDGPEVALDRPAHVRAGSALGFVGERLAVVQDDANFVALFDPLQQQVESIALPAGHEGLRQFDDGRGNKQWKLDLEACARVTDGDGEFLVAFGSGSTPRRERLVKLRLGKGTAHEVRLIDAPHFYRRLREAVEFSGSELNLEGAVWLGEDDIRLFQRGNGAPRGGLLPLNATCDISWSQLAAHLSEPERTAPPELRNIQRYTLGSLRGVTLGFTDAAASAAGLWYLAVAEASPDAVRDGPVAGVAIGLLARDGTARWTELRNADGASFLGKAEGISPDPTRADRAFIVLDRDDPALPSELCTVELSGPW